MAFEISAPSLGFAAQVPGLSVVRFILSEDERNPQVEREARLPPCTLLSSFPTAPHRRSQRAYGTQLPHMSKAQTTGHVFTAASSAAAVVAPPTR